MPKIERIQGTNGHDVLSGLGVPKHLVGGRGNDSYLVDDVGDVVDEKNNGGLDTVFASISWQLNDNVENLELTGDEDLLGSGNELDNVISGNQGSNILEGFDGNDTIYGGAGADTIDGGGGMDTAHFEGAPSDYVFTWNEQDELLVTSSDGTWDLVRNTEYLAFGDELLDVALLSQPGQEDVPPPEPVAPEAVDDYATLMEDGSVKLDVLGNDKGEGISLIGAEHGALGTVSINEDGTLSYTPAPNASGVDTLTYTIADAMGRTATGTVSLEISEVNDAPIAGDDVFESAEDVVLTGNVLANDEDPEGGTLLILGYDDTTPNGGTVLMLPDGSFEYRPAASFTGLDSFSYTVDDGAGGQDTAIVTVEVVPAVADEVANTAPVAQDDIYDVPGETSFTGESVLTNDSDPDGDTLAVSAMNTTTEAGGSVNLREDGTFDYAPATGFAGTDTFSYIITDEAGGTDTASVSLNVLASEPEPAPTPYYVDALLMDGEDARLNYPGSLGEPVTVAYSFLLSVPTYYSDAAETLIAETFQAFSVQQADATRQILTQIEGFSNLQFVEVDRAEDATITFGMFDIGGDSRGLAYAPSGSTTGTIAADVWIDSIEAGDTFDPGSEIYRVLLHELGHAMGLAHPVLPGAEENHQYTVMEAASHPWAGYVGEEASTYQLYDIAALQHLYGEDTTSSSGDDIYTFADLDDHILTIWDAGGHDTLDMSASDYAVNLDLAEGSFSDVSTFGQDNIAIAFDTEIEDAIGGDFDDVLKGNDLDNVLTGGAGNDALTGGAGADTFHYGAEWGQDSISDFTAGEDVIDLKETGLTLSDIAILFQEAGVVIEAGNHSILLENEEEFDETSLLF